MFNTQGIPTTGATPPQTGASMADKPPFMPLRGEQVQHHLPAVHLRSVNQNKSWVDVEGELWVTNQRLWFEPAALAGDALRLAYKSLGAAEPFALPLARLQASGERTVLGKPALRLLFDNSGREYFRVQHVDQLAQRLLEAQKTAPVLEYTRLPATENGVDRRVIPWGTLLKLAFLAATIGGAAYAYGTYVR
jgi:hypothetical protein